MNNQRATDTAALNRRAWAQTRLQDAYARAKTTPPRYGTDDWHRLPDTDPQKWAAVIAAAEAWAIEGDQLEQRLTNEIDAAQAAEHKFWQQAREHLYPAAKHAAAAAADQPTRRAASSQPEPRKGDYLGGPVPWEPVEGAA